MSKNPSLREPAKSILYGLVAALLMYSVVRSLVAAAGKPFWYDELLTLAVSNLGTWKAIVAALRLPVDGQPPLFHWIEHITSVVPGSREIVLRFPSIAALPVALFCIFVYVRRRSGDLVALLCAVILMATTVFQLYAIEARPYCTVVGCIAFALVCYDRAPSPVWTVLLAASLALAVSLHYMAILALAPFGLAEAVVVVVSKKFRWSIWVAFAAGAATLLIFWPLLAANKSYYGPHFWAHFEFALLPSAYGEIFLTNSPYGAGIMAVALVGVAASAALRLKSREADFAVLPIMMAEATLVFALAALPFIGYVIVVLLQHSALQARYVLPSAIGLCAAFGYILGRAKWGTLGLVAIFVCSVAAMHEIHFWRFAWTNIREAKSYGANVERFIVGAGHTDLPVVIPNARNLAPLVYYGSAALRDRFIYVTGIPQSSDSSDKSVEYFKLYMPFRVERFNDFSAVRREFLVYVEETDPGRDPLTPYLFREGWTLQTAAMDDWRRVYLVTERTHPRTP